MWRSWPSRQRCESHLSAHIHGCVCALCRANSSIGAMRPQCYSLLEKMIILGVIYGRLVWGGVHVRACLSLSFAVTLQDLHEG